MSTNDPQTTIDAFDAPPVDRDRFAAVGDAQRRLDGYDPETLPTRPPAPGDFTPTRMRGVGTVAAWKREHLTVAVVRVRTPDGVIHEVHRTDDRRPNPGVLAEEFSTKPAAVAGARELMRRVSRLGYVPKDLCTIAEKEDT